MNLNDFFFFFLYLSNVSFSQFRMKLCGICDEEISSGDGYLGQKGLETLKISKDIGDGLGDKLL